MLSEVAYQEIMQQRAVLKGNIEGAERDKEKYDQMKKAAQDRKEVAEARLTLYINFLQDAVEEYEAAHPPEPPA